MIQIPYIKEVFLLSYNISNKMKDGKLGENLTKS